jgi:hypothetical protein
MTLRDTGSRPRWPFWLLVAIASLIAVIPPLWLTGVLRPPRPLFHSFYVTVLNSERLPPRWVAFDFSDLLGNMCYFDGPRNLILLDLVSEPTEEAEVSASALRASQGEQQWLTLPYIRVLVPANPRDLLIVVENQRVIALADLQEGDADFVESWWDEQLRDDVVQELIDDDRISSSIRAALDAVCKARSARTSNE